MSTTRQYEWSTDDWVKKLKHQADNSRRYRQKLYENVGLKNQKCVLDVGCGTGIVTMDISLLTKGEVIGVDIDTEKLSHAKRLFSKVTNTKIVNADISSLPFKDSFFDLVIFNLFLVHVTDQQNAVNEMVRVTREEGIVLATLEIDYAGRFEYPESPIASLLLKNKGDRDVDVQTGRKLKALFTQAGLRTEIGMNIESNCSLLNDGKRQLEGFLNNFWVHEKLFQQNGWTSEQIDRYRSERITMIQDGLYFCFEPGFYAIGRKTP